jgi:GcrA cell cycle regulator
VCVLVSAYRGPTNEATMSWTDERIEQLKQHWTEGKSASQIASLLGNGISRNAVIGKVHRLGLAGRAKSPNSGGSRPRHPAPSPAARRVPAPRLISASPRMTRGATALAIVPEALAEAESQVLESVVVPMSLRVTIIELKEAMCRWPLGDPTSSEFRYCGSPVASGPYCAYHGGLAYQPAQERRRDRDRLRRSAPR